MAEALTAIHAAGVVHRDLKPGNVMLTDDRPIVIDFGIAQAGDATRLTQTGLVMGTPGYLAPEVIEGEPSSPASDVHSWGSTMAFAATGHLPFGGGSYETIFYRIISGRADLSGVPAPLVPLISAALARDPSHRPSANWLSAQAVTLDMSAATATATYNGVPLTETQYPREAVSIPAVAPPAPAPPAPAARAAAAPPAPKQAARDVADLLPPVSYPPDFKPQNQRRTGARLARGARRAPSPPRAHTGTRICRTRIRLAPRRPAEHRRRTRLHGRAGGADRGAAGGRAARLAGGDHPAPRGGPGAEQAGGAPFGARAAGQRPGGGAGHRAAHGGQGAAHRGADGAAGGHRRRRPPTVSRWWSRTARTCRGPARTRPRPRWPGTASARARARPRRQLNRMAGAVARTRTSAAAITLSVWALAVAAVLFASSQTPYYWPAVAPHLPSLHDLIMSVSHWLLRNTHL